MVQLFDTSVLVAALSTAHASHDLARVRLAAVLQGEVEMAVSTHTVAELYATLTALPTRPPVTPGQARHLIDENVFQPADVVALVPADYEVALRRMADLGLVSGAIYDALHVRAAEKVAADELLTFNGRDFRRMPPEGPTRLVVL
jgi:predicted nucleic acid-binding protein